MKGLERLLETLSEDHGLRQATLFVAADLTAKLTRRHRPDGGMRQVEFVLTIGKPNYADRFFIKRNPALVGMIRVQRYTKRKVA